MISIAVVTRRAGFTLTMNSPGHHFTEVRPAAGWLERRLPEDVLVLDLETADATAEAVTTLRSSQAEQPIIVVANDTDGWDSLIADHPDLFLVSLPVTRTSLLSTVDRAARLSHVVPATAAPVTALEVDAAPAGGALTDVVANTDVAVTARGGGQPTVPLTRAGTTQRSRRARPGPAPQATTPAPTPASALAPASAPAPAPEPGEPESVTLPAGPVQLVRQLRPLVGQLSRVPEVAELVRQRCASTVACEASAVLVPDGDIWRVAAGANLRPLENRLQIDSIHWLVTELIGQGHGVVIRDTDIVRTRLSGAPLAAWPNLLALPVAEVNAVVLLARQVREFSRSDLIKAKHAIGPAALQLGEALDVRDLARALSGFANPVE